MNPQLKLELEQLEAEFSQQLEERKNVLIKNYHAQSKELSLVEKIEEEKKEQWYIDQKIDKLKVLSSNLKYAKNKIVDLERDMNFYQKQIDNVDSLILTPTEKLHEILNRKTVNGDYLYVVEDDTLFRNSGYDLYQIEHHIAPRDRANRVIAQVCKHEVIDHIKKYRD